MTFEEYLRTAPAETRNSCMQSLRRFGEPSAVLRELAAIPPCVQNESMDVRINHKYLLWYRNKAFLTPARAWIFQMDTIEYCYLGFTGRYANEIGLIGYNGARQEFLAGNSQECLRIYHTLSTYIKGFEKVRPASERELMAELEVPAGVYISGRYVLRNRSLLFKRKAIFGGWKEQVKVPDIHQIVWCDQRVQGDSDGDSYLLDLYLLNQREACRLYFSSNHAAFCFALELKKRVPHLLYGFHEEYARLHTQDPAALLALARRKAAR